MRKKIKLITAKSITINRFLDQIVIDLFDKYDLTILCNDPNKLKISAEIDKEKVNIPDNLGDLINPLKIIGCIYQLRLLLKNTDCIYLHTPLTAHLARIAILTKLKKPIVIYHVHGLRYISGSWNLKVYLEL